MADLKAGKLRTSATYLAAAMNLEYFLPFAKIGLDDLYPSPLDFILYAGQNSMEVDVK